MSISFDKKLILETGASLALLDLQTRNPGIYYAKLDLSGDSILSTVFIESVSPGASVLVEYYDFTTGEQVGEANLLKVHAPLNTNLATNRVLVGNSHDKVYMKATVGGGSIKFSVYVTIVSTSASELTDALVYEDQIANLIIDKSISIGAYDETDGKYKLIRVDQDGRLIVSAIIGAKSTPTISNLQILQSNFEYVYDFPTGTKEFYLQNRDEGLLKFSYNIGESGFLYKTIFPGSVLSEINIDKTSMSIYIQSTKSNQTVEIVSWA